LLSEAVVRSEWQVPPVDRVRIWARPCSSSLRCRAAPRLVELPEGVSSSCVPGPDHRAGRALHESQTPSGRVAMPPSAARPSPSPTRPQSQRVRALRQFVGCWPHGIACTTPGYPALAFSRRPLHGRGLGGCRSSARCASASEVSESSCRRCYPGSPPMLRAGDRLSTRQRAERGPTRVSRRCSQAGGSPSRPIVPKAVERLFGVESEST
jgi:hypothetical protein